LGLTKDFVWEWINGGIRQTPREGTNRHQISLKCVGVELKAHGSAQLDPHPPNRVAGLKQQVAP